MKKKTTLFVMCIAVTISMIAVGIFDHEIRKMIQTQYEARSIDIANLVSLQVDVERLMAVRDAVCAIYDRSENKVMSDQWGTPEFEAYVSQYTGIAELEEHRLLLADLRRMQDVLDVNCLTLIWLDAENECYLYLVDADYAEPCPIGCIDPLFLEHAEALTNPSVGLPPTISNSPEYGWLIATAMPVFDARGEVVAFAAVDISMNAVLRQEHRYLLYTMLAFLAATVAICFVGILFVSRFVIRPINTLSRAAAQYSPGKRTFSELHIPKGDEIGILADSMARMETDISGYIENLEKTSADLLLARENAAELNRVANIDPLTGVRNKRAYDVEAVRLSQNAQPYGLVMIDLNGLKRINDTYGHEKGDISIRCLCRIICQTFRHSPVFRVGGDEFIVILENDDYADRDALIRAMKDALRRNADDAALSPWERITAAVGYAIHDPASRGTVELVLKSADREMYQNKKAMKASESAEG